jgi:uncharacterized protein involved in propanediol utilization
MNEFVNRIEGMLRGEVLDTESANEIRQIINQCDKQDSSPLPRKEVISIQPGDVIVLSSPTMLSESMAKMIEMKAQAQFPDNTILVLEDSMTMEVYREQVKE